MDLNKVMTSLSQNGVLGGFAGGLAGGVASSALTSKRAGKNARKLLKIGGLAAVGGLAWKAFHTYQQKQADARDNSAAPADSDWNRVATSRFVALGDAVTPQSESLLVIRAMIAAALADRHLDADEQRRIFDQLDQADLTPAERSSLFEELRNPQPVEAIAAVVDDAETAIEVYAASLLAVDHRSPANQVYLQRLADALRLPDGLVQELHASATTQQSTGKAA